MLSDVGPGRSAEDEADRAAGDSVVCRQLLMADPALGVASADGQDFRLVQFGDPVPFAFGLPPLCDHVVHVLLPIAQENVGNINTSRCVARMASEETWGDWANQEFVHDSICVDHPSVGRPGSDDAVAADADGARPEDAAVRLGRSDVAPEAFRQRDGLPGFLAVFGAEASMPLLDHAGVGEEDEWLVAGFADARDLARMALSHDGPSGKGRGGEDAPDVSPSGAFASLYKRLRQ